MPSVLEISYSNEIPKTFMFDISNIKGCILLEVVMMAKGGIEK